MAEEVINATEWVGFLGCVDWKYESFDADFLPSTFFSLTSISNKKEYFFKRVLTSLSVGESE